MKEDFKEQEDFIRWTDSIKMTSKIRRQDNKAFERLMNEKSKNYTDL